MRGLPEYNFPSFYKAEEELLSKNIYSVVNPARLDEEQEGFDPTKVSTTSRNFLRKVMRRDINDLLSCDGVYMLFDWHTSEGARIEHALASMLGLYIMYQ